LTQQVGYSFKDELLARIAQSQEMQQVTTEDYYQYMGQIYYLVKDEEVMALLRDDKDLKDLMPALSHLVRTSNITDKNIVKGMMLRWRRACRIQLLVNKTPKLVSQAKFDAWVNYGYAAIQDAVDGWRGRLVTERIKTYKIEGGSQKKGLLDRILGR
jgi:hypothetical protein